MVEHIPFLGCGMGYRRPLHDAISEHAHEVDLLELIPEHFMHAIHSYADRLEWLKSNFKLAFHSLGLSIGTRDINFDYLRRLKKLIVFLDIPYLTDHLATTHIAGIGLGHLAQVEYTESVLESCIEKAMILQDFLEVPLVFENITTSFAYPTNTMSQEEFLSRFLDASKCGMLWDVTNSVISALNQNIGLDTICQQIPFSRIMHIHLSGGNQENGEWIDSHSYPVPDQVWSVLSEAAPHLTHLKAIILERDSRYNEPFETLLADVQHAKRIFNKHVS